MTSKLQNREIIFQPSRIRSFGPFKFWMNARPTNMNNLDIRQQSYRTYVTPKNSDIHSSETGTSTSRAAQSAVVCPSPPEVRTITESHKFVYSGKTRAQQFTSASAVLTLTNLSFTRAVKQTKIDFVTLMNRFQSTPPCSKTELEAAGAKVQN